MMVWKSATRPEERRLKPRSRKVWLVAHVAGSVGWLGTAYAMTVLGAVAGWAEPVARHASFEMVHACDRYVMIPLSLVSLATGLVVSLGTRWGVLKHYWVTTKLVVTVLAMLFATFYQSQWVKEAIAITAERPDRDLSALSPTILTGSLGMTSVLLFTTVLSVVKPWGRTSRGRRTLADRRSAR
ncbi:hypothetical protein [Amycolatopsis sp. CA-230715]|uniref:hypothetical protein n=1 Tax=Amycolatopsis sp. CA-230715 TaxID=2745196 RepID=UPI001C00D63F|nr:hypothetical protein [Amycolatopsis sp. CA-230715]QWF83539.1 hypothetical protein HUW46_06980 [Amycolatopsis sp. CA-230715]